MAKTYHQRLVDKASDFIRRVHSDQTVTLEQTLDSLELLREEIFECITAVELDIELKAGLEENGAETKQDKLV